MKKIWIVLFTLFLFMQPIKVSAVDYKQETENIAEEYNIDVDKITRATPEDIFNYIINRRKENRQRPLRLLIKLSGIILVCRLIKVFTADSKNSVDNITDSVCILIVFLALSEPIRNIILKVSDNLFRVKNFMSTFLPLFGGIAMASGEVFTSAVYSGFFLSGIIFISSLCINIILPSLQMYFALIVSNSLSPFIRLKSIGDFYIKSVKWLMKSIVSVICFVLTLQTTLTSGKENLAIKAGKALAGSAIPVIGSVLQDAIGSVYAGMEAIKGFAGVVGMFVVIDIFLPSVIIIGIYNLCINILFILCDIFDLKGVGDCVKGFGNVTELLLSVIFLFMILLIFSLTIMINFTGG